LFESFLSAGECKYIYFSFLISYILSLNFQLGNKGAITIGYDPYIMIILFMLIYRRKTFFLGKKIDLEVQ